jgi:hypothetical protein
MVAVPGAGTTEKSLRASLVFRAYGLHPPDCKRERRELAVHTWPTLYILDQRGIIRHRFKGFPGAGKLDTAINALVRVAEAG